jgi:hypothetical protein
LIPVLEGASFNPSVGKVTITDFNVSQDVLAFDHRLFASATAQVLNQTHDSKAGAVSWSTTTIP